jgi:DNA-binding GntR family transcriptional regulator
MDVVGAVTTLPRSQSRRARPRADTVLALTKSDLAYQQVRQRILEGSLAPGSLIDQEALAADLGLSTTPVREALRRLESERLVISRAHRDTVVAPVSVELLEEVYTIRLALDPIAVSLTAQNASQDALDELAEFLGEDVESLSTVQHLHHNRDLHRAIYSACGNSILIQTLDSLWDLSDRYRMITLQDNTTIKSAAAEHAAIVQAVVDRKAELASSLMRDHVAESLQRIRSISTTGEDGPA